MPSFVIGGDETCLLASNGVVSIIGDKDKKKHEIAVGTSRTSITLYRTGSAAGVDGPTGTPHPLPLPHSHHPLHHHTRTPHHTYAHPQFFSRLVRSIRQALQMSSSRSTGLLLAPQLQ